MESFACVSFSIFVDTSIEVALLKAGTGEPRETGVSSELKPLVAHLR